MKKKRVRIIESKEEEFLTLEEAMERFIRFKKTSGIADLTLRNYNSTFRRFMVVSENRLDVKVLEDDIMVFLTPLSDASPAKFNVPYSNLNALFNWLILQEVLESNPLKNLGLKKKKDEGNIRCIAVEDVKKLLNAIDLTSYAGIRDYTILLLILDCGIRPSEIFGLKIEDIDFDNKLVTISREIAKTRTKRVLPLTDTVIELLDKMIDLKPTEWFNDLVFCSYDGLQMHAIMFAKRLQVHSEKAKVKVTPYDLRHTFAILYLRNGGNVFTLQETMGHTDLRMTQRYLAISQDDMKDQHTKATPLQNIVQRNTRVNKLFK